MSFASNESASGKSSKKLKNFLENSSKKNQKAKESQALDTVEAKDNNLFVEAVTPHIETIVSDSDMLKQTTQEQSKVVETQVAAALAHYEGLIANSTSSITQKKDQVIDAIDSNIVVARTAIGTALSEAISDIDIQKNQVLNDISQTQREIDELTTVLENAKTESKKIIDAAQILQNTDQDYVKNVIELQEKAKERAAALQQELALILAQYEDMVAKATKSINDKRNQILATIDANLKVARSAIGTALTHATSTVDIQKTDAISSMSQINHDITELKYKVTEALQTTEGLSHSTNELEKTIDKSATKIVSLTSLADEQRAALLAQEKKATEIFDALLNIAQELNQSKASIQNEMQSEKDKILKMLNESESMMLHEIENRNKESNSNLKQIHENIHQLEVSVAESQKEEKTLENHMQKLAEESKDLEKKLHCLNQHMTDSAKSLDNQISSCMNQYKTALTQATHQINEKRNHAIGQMDASNELTRHTLQSSLKQAMNEIDAQKKLALSQMSQIIEQSTRKLLEIDKVKGEMVDLKKMSLERYFEIENERKKILTNSEIIQSHLSESESTLIKMRKKFSEASKISAHLMTLKPNLMMDADVQVQEKPK